ncbi:DUF1707 and DUF4870 domain-containing protein [Actinomadura sp. ATCC 31491]|uniref:DUF1707 and DUF4870 domain-containing protein n=1 Tax=Actinomadura luzonensis TaxID=2805427 RepID=A0ABT0FZP7_9ACTN|nr:DUF1707 and DUF4870 domain-containing protein [Actinomadura luzonensis]MCK2217808.1 DUF1707 and DUF4870 domain-containing protein [Actinomadura luzonensis]
MAGVPTTPGPGQVPPAHLRVTNQDREHVVEHVKAAYAEGRFDKLEFDDRLERAMTARTHGDLMPIMTELYGPQGVPQLAPRPAAAPARPERMPEGNERLGAAAAHLLMAFGFPIIGPLIMLLAAGKTSPYIRRHAVEALNFQMTVVGATILLPFTVIGVVLLPVIWVAAFVLTIVGGVNALTEGNYRYPLTVRLVK